jgi:hypothetical protein
VVVTIQWRNAAAATEVAGVARSSETAGALDPDTYGVRTLRRAVLRRPPAVDPAACPEPPRPGQQVSLRHARSRGAMQARVVAQRPGNLAVELAEGVGARRGGVELEWVNADGLARLHGRAWLVREGAAPILEIRYERPPELIQRRQHLRAELAFPCSAWSLLDPTRLLAGETVNVSGGGALVRLPKLPPAAPFVDLHLELPDGPLDVRGTVVRRDEGDLVALGFDWIGQVDEERLIGAVLGSLARAQRAA